MKILIADDHAVLRKGLIQLVVDELPRVEFGEAGSTQQTLDELSRQRWDLLILDIFMPGEGGLAVLEDVQHRYPKLPVLVLSSAPEEQLATRVLKAGARGYLNKQVAAEELVGAVRKVATGGRYVSATMAERLAEDIGWADRPPHDQLSTREYSVLRLVVAGKPIKKIAQELRLSPKTVSTYHTRIWKKLRVDNNADLVRYALEHDII